MPKLLEVVKEPTPSLRQKSKPVKDFSAPEIQNLIPDLIHTMYKKDGIGIAAPQVGVNIRMVVINTADGPMILINPEITFKSKKMESEEEGCLSVPGVYGFVKRYQKIKVKALTYNGKHVNFSAENLFARIIQHEIDHIDGILFIDKAEKLTSTGKAL